MSDVGRIIIKLVFWSCFTATVYTYFLYPLLLAILGHWAKRRHARHHEELSGDLPTVTMVICAYNEEAVLADKIANCRQLDYPRDKLTFLFGSDGSDDGTARILSAAADDRIRVVISKERRGKVGMMNMLMPSVDSEVVVFSDANTMYDPTAVRELVLPLADPKVGCVNGKLELSTEGPEKVCETEGLYWRYENRIKEMENTLGVVPTINGGIFAIRRSLYQQLPSHAVTEDQVLGMKIMVAGYRCRFSAAAHAHEHVSTWSGELRRRIRISAGNFQSLLLVPNILNPRCGWVTFAFISHKLLRWLVPLFLVAMLSANVLLAGQPFYGSTLLAQAIFYLSGLIGITPGLTGLLKTLAIPKYFLAMNLAILIGLARFLSGRQRVTWAKVQR